MRILVIALILSTPVHAVGGVVTEPPKTAAKTPPPWDLLWTIDPPDGEPARPRPKPDRALEGLGSSLYHSRCAACHGDQGDGQGPLAADLLPRPTDFVRGLYKLRSTPTGSLPTDKDLFRTLTRGIHGTAMRPWRRLNERERWALVDKLKAFSPRFVHEPVAAPIAIPSAPRETNELRVRGENLYVQHRCGVCHGDGGEGNGPAAFALRGRRDIEIRNFTRGRFIRGAMMEDIYQTLRIGIDGTPMRAYATLKDDEVWALAAYVRVLVHEHPLGDLPPAGIATDEHDPGAASPPPTAPPIR